MSEPKANTDRFWQFLTDDGTKTGDPDFANDYSSTTGYAYIQPPADKVYAIYRLIGYFNETSGLDPNDYGNLPNLTNGVTVDIKTGGPTGTVVQNLTEVPIRVNEDWAQYAGTVYPITFAPNQAEAFIITWNFVRDGSPVFLNGDTSDVLVMTFDDDLSGMTAHTFRAHGLIYDIGA